ncbi:MAG TPA: hypothetical protein IAC43_04970, partial [Candidatus Faecivivens stercoripullorum]|nr:hypothetical protein [Candidatus Faecivivens stercoripullorum]
YTIYLTGELRVYDLKTGEDAFLGQMWDTPSADYNGPFWIDEDKIYCLSYTESGQPAVQVLSLEGTPERTIAFAHQTPFPFWVEDRTLYYAARLDNQESWQTFELNLDTGETSDLQIEGHCNILGEKDGRLAIAIRSEGYFFLDADGTMEPVEEGYSFAQVNDSAEYYWRHELMGSVLCRKQEDQMQDIAWFDNYCPDAVLEDGFLYIQRLSNLELYDIELVNAAQVPDDVLSEILEYRHTKMRDYTVSLAVSPDGILYLLDANIYS